MREVVAFLCDFCPPRKARRFAGKSYAKRHEDNCFFNPARRACATCEHFCKPEKDISDDGFPIWSDMYCCEDAFNKSGEEDPRRFNCPAWKMRETPL